MALKDYLLTSFIDTYLHLPYGYCEIFIIRPSFFLPLSMSPTQELSLQVHQTFQRTYSNPISRCLHNSIHSVEFDVVCNISYLAGLHGDDTLDLRPARSPEDSPLSSVRGCLIYTFAAVRRV